MANTEEPTFQVIEFAGRDAPPCPRSFAARELLVLPDRHGAVRLLRVRDLDALMGSVPRGLLADRGTKHRAKPLAGYLVGRDGLLAIRANYRDAGQALRGVRSLVDAAARSKAVASFFVGVPDPLFDALVARAEPASPGKETARPDAWALGSVLAQDAGIEVPESLRAAYVGSSEAAEWVRRAIVLAAGMAGRHPVLIEGESGTGKEIVAWQIHLLAGGVATQFFPVNCGGIPDELLESTLFGHVKGAFTSAVRDKKGFWELANKGTLFLDEIGDLSPRHQVKVLRALDSGTFVPVGADANVCSEARVIAATNRDLGQMVREKRFREDLFYRLFTFRIRTPALREHPEDIPVLARMFWANDHRDGPLTESVTDALRRYFWPGNVRELRAFLINLAVVANGRRPDARLVHAVMRDRVGPLSAGRPDR